MLNIVCVNNNNYLGRGEEYVSRLRDGVSEYCNVAYNFIVMDKCMNNGWWAKLELFKAFPKGDRVLYFDLDTVITDSIDDIAAYDGYFAALRDFYRPNDLGSGVMAWEAGTVDKIYDRWVELGKPELMGGDQQWIYMMMPDAVRLQDVYPGKFASYKIGNIENASVVCFHGKPRPHEVNFNPDRRELCQ